MNRAVNILASAMPDGPVLFQLAISGIFVSRNEADFFRDCFADEAVQRCGIGMLDNTGDNIPFALDGTDNSVLAFAAGPWRALIPMPISVLAADVSFINFDNANELAEFWIGEPGADAMAHIEGGRIGSKTHHAMYLQRRDSLLASQHQIDGLEPNPQRNIRVFENRPDQDREAISLRRASWAFPFKWHSLQRIYAVTSAMRRQAPHNRRCEATFLRSSISIPELEKTYTTGWPSPAGT